MTHRTLALLSSIVLLSGCSMVAELYQRPETATPAEWTAPVATIQAEPWPGADWWRRFQSPGLDGLMHEAEQANLDLAAAAAQVRQAEAQVKVSGASLWPSLQAGAGAAREQTRSSSSGTGAATKSPVLNSANATLTTSYELDFWGKNAATLASAEASLEAYRFNLQTVRLSKQALVANTYFAVLGYRERERIARENLANAEEVLAAVRDQARIGTATALDVAQQENEVAVERAAIPPLEQTLKQNFDALAILVGRPPQNLSLVPEALDRLALPAVTPGLPSDLLTRRPDVAYAEAQLVAANADITVARAAFFPSISLTAEGGFQSAALETLFMHRSLLWSLASSLTQPIFKGGQLEGTLELKKAHYEELVFDYRKAVYQSFADVEDALIAVAKTAEQEAAQRQAVATARTAYEISRDQLRGGTVNINTVLNTQRSLFSAQDSLVQVRLSHLQAVVGLYKALGGGWSTEPSQR